MNGNDLRQTGVKITLDKERNIVFDLNALCELEDKYGDIGQALTVLSPQEGMPKMKDIRYMFYLGLKSEDEELTEERVGKLITLNNIYTVVDVIGKAMSDSLPEPSENEKNA